MVSPTRPLPNLPQPPARPAGSAQPNPWDATGELRSVAFATLWTTGPDPRLDGLFRAEALRRNPRTGQWEAFGCDADPFAESDLGAADGRIIAAAHARMERHYGVTMGDLDGAVPAKDVALELATFLAGRTVVVLDRGAFLARTGAFEGRVHDLASMVARLLPGRLAGAGNDLPAELLGLSNDDVHARHRIVPADLRASLCALLSRVLEADEATLALQGHALIDVIDAVQDWAPEQAEELRFCLRLLEHPSKWRGNTGTLYPNIANPGDGRLSDAVRAYATLEDALEAALPPWARVPERPAPSLPPFGEDPPTLDSADRAAIDKVFEDYLPERLARDGVASYRAGQHALAAHIASGFGARDLMLTHAPTGTGKTLAYLVPVMLWAYRNSVRVGVATYTRALQEQAMEHDVPVAHAMLERIGVKGVRVALLKGRRNYLCWRALIHQLPKPGSSGDELLAWLTLTTFGLTSPTGDLDQLTLRPPLASMDARAWQTTMSQLVHLVRAQTGCCSLQHDRLTCGAEAARRRAERSHVVITNHAFAMSRREFFRYLVFDECEHLHDVAHNAFSHTVGVRNLRDLLTRFFREGEPSTGTLSRIIELAEPRSEAWTAAFEAVESRGRAEWALMRLNDEVVAYKNWRRRQISARMADDTHSLFREYAESEEAFELLSAHADLHNALNRMSVSLQRLAEHFDSLDQRHARRLRRSLEIQRGELDDHLRGVEAWIPRGEDATPAFRGQTFHDLETTARKDDVLAARVLLPHEHLGRHYYPDLLGAVLISATTWIKGGFETSATFLGLTRAITPAEDEDRVPSTLTTFRAPEPFDYGRVLVAIPRDAPPVSGDKQAFLSYTTRFIAYLAERTRGRMLVLFTNASDLLNVGRDLEPFFAERHMPFWYQRMEGTSKEELGELFRTHTNSVMLGLDTFWYGTDFPGSTLEYLVIVRLPYGVPGDYHKAQCAALGSAEQRRQIYLPRALAKLRQGFGRLMRRETDRGCVFFLDKRILDPRHRVFLKELPLSNPFGDSDDAESRATLVSGSTDRCIEAALSHMKLVEEVQRRGLGHQFEGWGLGS